MSPQILLFILSNLILLTVNITASRLILLLLIAIATLRAYKWILNCDEIDKFVLFPKGSVKATRHKKGTQLSDVKEIITFAMSMLLENKKIVVEIWMIMVSILFIMLAEFIPSVTICIFSLDLVVMVCLIRRQLGSQPPKVKSLGVKRTSSIYFNEIDSPIEIISQSKKH